MKVPISTTTPRPKSGRWLTATFRSLKFQLLWFLTKASKLDEVKKVALYKDRGAALSHTILHLLPAAVGTTLVILNLKTTYIGDMQTNSITALQFAAKLLEVLIQASIAAITLSIFRQCVLQMSQLPFGGLIAPYRTTDISFLWSAEFWGCVTAPAVHLKMKILLCLTLSAAIVLAALVGPSSAVLMIPRPMDNPCAGALYLLDQEDKIYPRVIGLEPNGTLRDEDLFNQTSKQIVINEAAVWSSPIIDIGGPRDVKWTQDTSYVDDDSGTFSNVLATAPTLLSILAARSSQTFGLRTSVLAVQPFVHTECWSSYEQTPQDINNSYIDFGPGKTYLNNFLNLSMMLPSYVKHPDDDTSVMYHEEYPMYDYPAQQHDPTRYSFSAVWSKPPPGRNNDSLLMAYAFVQASAESHWSFTLTSIIACTIDAYWATATTNVSLDVIGSSDLPQEMDTSASALARLRSKTLITLSPEWAKATIMSISTLESTSIEFLSVAQSIFSFVSGCQEKIYATALSYIPPWRSDSNMINPYPRGLHLEDDIWRNDTSMSDEQFDTLRRYISTKNLPADHQVYVYAEDPWTDPATLAQLQYTISSSGYGYDASSTTVKLSLAVLLFYLTATAVYLVYSVSTGYAATSWDSIAELTALALNSQRPEALENTSVGIDTLETFRRPVSIWVNEHGSLEIVFDAAGQSTVYKKVQVNERY